ncbi:undecaprenyldiphospho-muramoylpentapeptide beta-N- acetylglucosaminyltransferase [Lysinibacillus sphaericus]|nr:undecaprenyldiphospho-muramoylpentapeptide beta-N- acetylglucosaminyltransferase [Lysinibacillus sphaericus]
MNIIIRTDASVEIGTGHVMRCLTLAKQLKRHGANVTFVCRELEGNSISYLQSENMDVLVVPGIQENSSDLDWVKENMLLDAEETSALLIEKNSRVDVLVVDHYALDKKWEEKFRSIAIHIFVIDDLANRKHDCDFLLDQNYYVNMEERYNGLVPEWCDLMLGPDYVLLRDEFIEAAKKMQVRTSKVENLLVFFGGTDPTGETIKALTAIRELDVTFKNIDVVVGLSNPKKNQIRQLCKEVRNTRYHCQVSNMAELMLKADLAIGAGGATTWERCILGLPSLSVIVADNQLELTKTLSTKKILLCVELSQQKINYDFNKKLKDLASNPLRLLEMSKYCREIIRIEKVRTYPVTSKLMEDLRWNF